MTADLSQVLRELLRDVVREELRAALAERPSAEALATYEQAAKFANCSKATIQNLVSSGALPATGKPRGLRRVKLSDVATALGSAPRPAARSRADEILSGLSRSRRKA